MFIIVSWDNYDESGEFENFGPFDDTQSARAYAEEKGIESFEVQELKK